MMKYSQEEVDAIIKNHQDAYLQMLEQLWTKIHGLEQTNRDLIRAKTAAERDYERLLKSVNVLFADHEMFDELQQMGWYEDMPSELDQ